MNKGVTAIPVNTFTPPDRLTIALALLFGASGVGHFVFRDTLARAIPDWLPYHGFLVAITGILELLAAIGLLLPVSRIITAWLLLAMLVAVFPANIQMLASARVADAPSWAIFLLWMRLPLQPVLIWMVYRYAAAPPQPVRPTTTRP